MDSLGQCKHNPLARIIQEEVARQGIITFARYMELALYHPDHGYYCQSRIGKSGDFFTSVSVGPLFGKFVGVALKRYLQYLPGEVQIVEAGANDGALAHDILTSLQVSSPDFAQRVIYSIIEPLAALRQRQEQTLGGFRARWFASVDEVPDLNGAFLSNELLDAFPVHVFRWQAGERQWREAGVGPELNWALMPDTVPAWACEALSELRPLQPYLPDQFSVEFSPSAEQWWQTAARKLKIGVMMAFDYGDFCAHLWTPGRAQGTLRAFREHHVADNVLANPGEQDITASVNFSRIQDAGEKAGLGTFPLKSQERFLSEHASELWPTGDMAPEEVRQFQTLTHPDHLGRAFKVFTQARGPSFR